LRYDGTNGTSVRLRRRDRCEVTGQLQPDIPDRTRQFGHATNYTEPGKRSGYPTGTT